MVPFHPQEWQGEEPPHREVNWTMWEDRDDPARTAAIARRYKGRGKKSKKKDDDDDDEEEGPLNIAVLKSPTVQVERGPAKKRKKKDEEEKQSDDE